jgi:hypothetical protein
MILDSFFLGKLECQKKIKLFTSSDFRSTKTNTRLYQVGPEQPFYLEDVQVESVLNYLPVIKFWITNN